MNMIRQELMAVGCLSLAIAGCERNSHEAPAAPDLPSARSSETVAPVAEPELVKDQPQAESFPITPNAPSALDPIPTATLVNQDDVSLSRTFLSSSGAAWNEALMEMKRRQTPDLLSMLTQNLDEIKGGFFGVMQHFLTVSKRLGEGWPQTCRG